MPHILLKAVDPPVINGVRKPRKPRFKVTVWT